MGLVFSEPCFIKVATKIFLFQENLLQTFCDLNLCQFTSLSLCMDLL